MIASNPYIAGNPVHGQNRFIGRQDILREALKTLRNPGANAIVLFGQRRIGKTSVLLHIEQALETRRDLTPVYFDLQDKAALPLAEVLYQLAKRIAALTTAPLPERDAFDEAGRFFRETFIPQAIQAAAGRDVVLLLDEFDVLDTPRREQAAATFFPYLRDWMPQAQGLQFVFVLGRRPEELSTDTLPTFKTILSRRVSLMSRDDSAAIIRQSEQNGSLLWSEAALERVWYWTQGHPFFTQLLGSEVWEAAMPFDEDDEAEDAAPDVPTVQPEDVEQAIDSTLERGANQFQWIWNGLPPAERIVMAAMSEAEGEVISREELTQILTRSKVRLILRELELAPETLVKWDILRPVDGGFRFAIPLLRRWVTQEKPLRRVKADLDSLEPLAESLYRSAEGFYRMTNLDEAERLLRNALNVNPNHFKARLLLGQVLVARGNSVEAVAELETAYKFDPGSSQAALIAALLSLAESRPEAEQLEIYKRVLNVDSQQAVALEKRQLLLRDRAECAEKQGDLDSALQQYAAIGDQENVERIQGIQRKQQLHKQLGLARNYEKAEDWEVAHAMYAKLLQNFPEEQTVQQRLKAVQTKQQIAELYTRACHAKRTDNRQQAQKLFAGVVNIQPDYKDAARYLHESVSGTRIFALDKRFWGVLLAVAMLLIISIAGAAISFYDRGYEAGRQALVGVPQPGPTPVPPTPTPVAAIEQGHGVEPLTKKEFVQIAGGCFQMGQTEQGKEYIIKERGEEKYNEYYLDELPRHEVCLEGFWMSKYEVTQAQWQAVMGENPSHFEGENRPVENVSWDDAQEFLEKLNEQTGADMYRLPTEAEWEYAARAGSKSLFCFGDDVEQLGEYAWYSANSDGKTHPIGLLEPNAWGLYDMHGNVWEWCQDTYHDNYDDAPIDGSLWGNLDDKKAKVLRGGSWLNLPHFCRAAYRVRRAPDDWSDNVGFRVVVSSWALQ